MVDVSAERSEFLKKDQRNIFDTEHTFTNLNNILFLNPKDNSKYASLVKSIKMIADGTSPTFSMNFNTGQIFDNPASLDLFQLFMLITAQQNKDWAVTQNYLKTHFIYGISKPDDLTEVTKRMILSDSVEQVIFVKIFEENNWYMEVIRINRGNAVANGSHPMISGYSFFQDANAKFHAKEMYKRLLGIDEGKDTAPNRRQFIEVNLEKNTSAKAARIKMYRLYSLLELFSKNRYIPAHTRVNNIVSFNSDDDAILSKYNFDLAFAKNPDVWGVYPYQLDVLPPFTGISKEEIETYKRIIESGKIVEVSSEISGNLNFYKQLEKLQVFHTQEMATKDMSVRKSASEQLRLMMSVDQEEKWPELSEEISENAFHDIDDEIDDEIGTDWS